MSEKRLNIARATHVWAIELQGEGSACIVPWAVGRTQAAAIELYDRERREVGAFERHRANGYANVVRCTLTPAGAP